MERSNIVPLPGFVLIKDREMSNSIADSGLSLPPDLEEKYCIGDVLVCGPDVKKDKETVTCPVKVGEVVAYKKYTEYKIMLEAIEYKLVEFENLIATIKVPKN